jgi:hypothetical protein
VDLVATTFNGTLWETMRLMQTTDVLLGMHGAGLTNTMFLPKACPDSASLWRILCAE